MENKIYEYGTIMGTITFPFPGSYVMIWVVRDQVTRICLIPDVKCREGSRARQRNA